MVSNEIILQGTTAKELIAEFKTAIKDVLNNNHKTSDTQDSDHLMTRDEVCAMLNINKSTLWKHTKRGKLKSYGIGRKVFYKRGEVIASVTPLKK